MTLTVALWDGDNTSGTTNYNNADSTTNWNAVTIAAPSDETDIYFTGSQGVSSKASKKAGELYYDYGGTTFDFTASGTNENHLVGLWIAVTTIQALEVFASGEGLTIRVYSNASNWVEFQIAAGDSLADMANMRGGKGGFIFCIVDPSLTATNAGGTVDLSAINFVGVHVDITVTVKSENLVIDGIVIAQGLQLTGSDTDGWDDITVYTTAYGSRAWGLAETVVGSVILFGEVVIGDAGQSSPTSLTDGAKTIVFGKFEYYESAAWKTSIPNDRMGISLQDNSGANFTTFEDGSLVSESAGTGAGGSTFTGSENSNCFFDMSDLTNTSSVVKLFGTIIRNFLTRVKLTSDSDHRCYSVIFDSNGQIDPVGAIKMRNCIIQGYVGTAGAFLWQSGVDIQNSQFLNNTNASDAPAVEHDTRGEFTYVTMLFSGNDIDINNTTTPTTTDSYSESNYDTDQPVGNGTVTQAGQSFLGDGNVLSQVRLYLKKFGSPTGNATVKIYASTGSDPNRTPTGSALIVSIDFDVSTLTGSYVLTKFNFESEQTLTAATTYFVVLDCTGLTVGDASNYVQWGTDTSSPTHSGNNFATYTGSWADSSTEDGCFYLYTQGLVIISKTVGSNPVSTNNATAPNGVYTALVGSVNLTFTGLIAGSEVRAYVGDTTDPANAEEIGGVENSSTSFAFSHSRGGEDGYVIIHKEDYVPITLELTYSSSDQTIPIQQQFDRNYSNP